MVDARRKRCAIYTRKSSEEGLEQEFNSLQAQRESCEAFVKSQRHEGWVALAAAYDDGGFSGGTMGRPGLQHLLADIRAGRVDAVVTYKVDRLTRSLADFARLIETFDAHAVSFVSVTQQFNTTTSMGRLTLNVLLSFAQFEREVTGERIRDKIAASKAKGMWMGGYVPLGYNILDRRLIVNPAEAGTIRRLFALYRELGCVRRVKEAADRLGLTSKPRIVKGISRGGKPFTRGHLYRLLSNPIYIGQIAHKDQHYDGQHEAVIDRETWAAVQAGFALNATARRHRTGAQAPSLLTGLLFDAEGERLSPSHAVKNGRRYRYYVSRSLIIASGSEHNRGWRLPAHDIEAAVIGAAIQALADAALLTERLGLQDASQIRAILDRAERIAAALEQGSPQQRMQALRSLVDRIVIGEDALEIALRRATLLESPVAGPENPIGVTVPLQLRRRGVALKLVVTPTADQPARPDPALIKAVGRGHRWFEDLVTRRAVSIQAIAKHEGITEGYVRRLVRLAFLAPHIVDAIVQGEQPVDLTAARLTGMKLPPLWHDQQQALGC